MAKVINRESGGAVISPWEIEGLTEEWLMTFRKMASELPEMKEQSALVEDFFAERRRDHPNYGRGL